MPLSDKYNYNVGDRVKSDTTRDEGRVVDIKALGQGALLITVAIFVGGVLSTKKSFIQKVGQISGLDWSILGKAKEGGSKLAAITNPLEGGQVSAAAAELALSNQPAERSITKLISDRLKSWNPKNVNPDDELAFANALFDRLQHLQQVRTGVFKNKGRVDTLMNYLTATGRKGANGQWYGSYLTELVHSPGQASSMAIDQGDKIRVILQRTGISPDLALRYREFIPEGVNTAWELLVHAKQRIKGLNYTEGNPLWNDYASIIKRAVEMTPSRRRTQSVIDALNEAIDFTGDTLSSTLSPSFSTTHGIGTSLKGRTLKPYIVTDSLGRQRVIDNPTGRSADPTRFGVYGGATEPEVDARTAHQLDVRLYGRPKDIISGRGEGSHTGRVDLKKRGIDRFSPKRQEQSPTVESILQTGTTPGARDIGDRTALARNRIGRPKVNGPKTAQEIFDNSGMFEGKVVQYKGLPYRIVNIGDKPGMATLVPLHTDVELLATDISRRPGSAIEAIKGLGRRANELPLAADVVAQRAGQQAKRVSEAIAARKTIGIRGGLLGATNDTVQVPMDLLREYLVGANSFKDRQALQAAGFAGVEDFAKRSRNFSNRFTSSIRQRLSTSRILNGLTGTAAEQKLEELMSGARLAMFEHMASIQGGRSIQQLEEELLHVAVRRAPKLAFGEQHSVVASTFTELDRVVGGEVVESGLDRVSRLAGRQAASLGASFDVSSTGRRFFGNGTFVTTSEWKGALEDFAAAIEGGKASGRPAGQILRGAFDQTFGGFGVTNPGKVPGIIDRADQLVDLALNLRRDMAVLGMADPGVQRQKNALLRSLKLNELRGTDQLDRGLDLYRNLRDNPEFGTTHTSTVAAAKSFLGEKSAYLERVQERFLRRQAVNLRGTKGEQIGAVEEGLTSAAGQILHPQHEQQYIDLFRAASELPLEQQLPALRALGIEPTLRNDQPAAVLTGKAGERFVLQETQGGMVAVNQSNPLSARFLGGANQPFEVGVADLQKAIEAEKFAVSKLTAEQVAAQAQRTARAAFVRDFIGGPPAGLPVFNHGNGVVGFLENDLVNAQSVIQNAKAAMEGKRALLFIDIETNREVNRITNFAFRRLEKVDGVWQEVGEAVQLATPELWQMHGVKGTPTSRIASRFGTTSIVNEVLENEQALTERAAQLIGQHSDAIVAGHNISFDITKLAQVPGISESAAATLAQTARTNVADTLLMAQLTHAGQAEFSLEALGRTIGGQMTREAHLALPDVVRNIEVFREIAKRSDHALAGLNALEQVKLDADSVLWTEQRGGRAFKVAGILDAEAASDAFFKQTGKNLGVGFGVALQPVDFNTGMPAGPFELNFAQTPHGWAKSFAGSFEVLDTATARARMETKASDLARRRIRRLTADDNAFTNLLAERQRIALAEAAVQGPDAFAAAQNSLIQRLGQTESDAERHLLRRSFAYSQTFLKDSRLVRQLELEKAFVHGEVGQAHKPVVDWLEGALQNAAPGQLPTVKEAANRVWNEYMAQVHEASPFPEIAVPHKPSVALNIKVLGEAPTTLWTKDAASLRTSLQQKVMQIAQKVQNTNAFNELFIDAPATEGKRVQALLAHGKNFLDTDLGATIESHIFEHHIAPAMEEGFVKLGEEIKLPLNTRARTVDDAVSAILARQEELVNQNKDKAIDYLASRTLNPDAIASIQDRLGVGGDILSKAEALASTENLKVAFHHNAPRGWTGKRFVDLVESAVSADEEAQRQFTDRVKGIYKRMSSTDRDVLSEVFKIKAPQWLDEITGNKTLQEAVQVSNPVRAFNPGSLTNTGIELSETITQNAQSLKAAGLIGLGIVAAGVGLLARRPRTSDNKTREEDDQERYLHSTELEVAKRKERVAKQQGAFNNIKVSITGDDPVGVDHNELTESVHNALGTFLGREIHRAASVNDNRSRIDRDYLDRLAGRLLQKSPPGR